MKNDDEVVPTVRPTAKDCIKMAWYYHKQNPRFGNNAEADHDAFTDIAKDVMSEDKQFWETYKKERGIK